VRQRSHINVSIDAIMIIGQDVVQRLPCSRMGDPTRYVTYSYIARTYVAGTTIVRDCALL
jgi:hypothetical protein